MANMLNGELQCAAQFGRLEKVIAFLTDGRCSCADKAEALHIAVQRCHQEIAIVLITFGANPNCYAFHTSVKKGYVNVVRAMLDVDVNVHCCEDISLYHAVSCSNLEIIEMLLAADINFRVRENIAMRQALSNGKLEVVKCLALKYTIKELEDIQKELRSPLLAEVIDLCRPRGLHTKAALREPQTLAALCEPQPTPVDE